MAPNANHTRTRLARIKPLLSRSSLEATRWGQDLLGDILEVSRRIVCLSLCGSGSFRRLSDF